MAKAKDVVLYEETLPEFMKGGFDEEDNRGSEGVGQDDITIPRLEVVQALSPCRQKKEAAYIEGAEEGMLYNSVTRELYGEYVDVIFVMFRKQWLVWKDRDAGGGFRGDFNSQQEANDKIVELVNEGDQGPWEAIDTGQHVAILIRADGRTEEIAVSMSKSKMKVSRQLNSMVRMIPGPRWATVFRISAVEEKNDKNQPYYNFHITKMGYPKLESHFKKAEKLYEDISSGDRDLKVNQDEEEEVKSEDEEKF